MTEKRGPSPLVACSRCRRHVRAAERRCPFCGVERADVPPPRGVDAGGRSRTGRTLLRLTLGLGAVQATAACGSSTPSPAPIAHASTTGPSGTAPATPPADTAPTAASSAPESGPAPSASVEPPRRMVAIYGAPMVMLPALTFDADSALLGPRAQAALAEIAALTKSQPEMFLVVEGHAEKSEKDAAKLSERRAGAVQEKLVELGVDRSRLRMEAHGDTQPLTAGSTADERAQNRRVAFRVTKADGAPFFP